MSYVGGVDVVTPECWSDLVKHVREKVKEHYWQVDGLTEYYSVCTLFLLDIQVMSRIAVTLMYQILFLTQIILLLWKKMKTIIIYS